MMRSDAGRNIEQSGKLFTYEAGDEFVTRFFVVKVIKLSKQNELRCKAYGFKQAALDAAGYQGCNNGVFVFANNDDEIAARHDRRVFLGCLYSAFKCSHRHN